MKTAVVTGASGFLGSHLSYRLAQKGYHVRVLLRNDHDLDRLTVYQSLYPDIPANAFEVTTGDILDPESLITAFNHADVVFHCAAMVRFTRSDLELMMETNVEGTANVVNACLRCGVPALIHASSVAALGRSNEQGEISESTAWTDSDWNTDYAISKHLAENEIWRGQEEGLNVSMVNPGVILGPCTGETGSGMIYSRARKSGKLYPAGSNGFVGVHDVAEMMENIYSRQLWGKRFIAVGGHISYKKLLDIICDAMGTRRPSVNIPAPAAVFLAKIFRFFEKLGIPAPLPSHGLISTARNNFYRSENVSLIPGFKHTPLENVILDSVAFLKLAGRI